MGLLGRGITACLLAHGFRTVVYDHGGAAVYASARTYIGQGLAELIAEAGFPASLASEWSGRYTEAASFAEFAGCTFVIESVVEDFAVKQQVFDQIEAAVPASVPIASNTSAIPISLLQNGRAHPERFLGMHWAEPAYATRFLELIRGERTGDDALQAAAALGRRTGKDPCIVRKDVPGFIVNRLGYAMYREALHLLETGVADVETIDRSFRNACGLWASLCGPFRWIDITGGPALYAKAMRGVLPTLSNTPDLPPTLQQALSEGWKGVLDGRGFYPYQPGDAERWQARLHRQALAIHRLQQESETGS